MSMVTAALAIAAIGCSSPGVQWDEPEAAPGDTLGTLAIGANDSVTFGRPVSPPTSPVDSAMCPRSLVFAAEGSHWYAAWLHRRPDSTVAVVAARSDDGQRWTTPGIADSVDSGKFGCERPAPSIAAAEGYVHVAYSLKAPEGYGVFFAHSMDQTATFHSAMIVVYGDRFSTTATAASGMRVAIAYENPNGKGQRVDVALSSTQGHTFDARVPGSPDEMQATDPRITIRDTLVALSFGSGSGGRALRMGRMTSR